MNKNLFLFAAAAALTFTACSDNDDMTASRDGSLSSNETTAVQFSTYLAGSQTRTSGGTVGGQTTATLGAQGFGVFAYSTGATAWATASASTTPNFMYNQKVALASGSTTNWEYSPIKYWPNDFKNDDVDAGQGTNGEANNATGTNSNTDPVTGGKVSFFAYAPYVDAKSYETASTTLKHGNDNAIEALETATPATTDASDAGILGMTFNDVNGDPYIRYSLASTNIANAVDLLWGTAMKKTYNTADGKTQTLTDEYNKDLTKQAVNEKIGFSFKHALAKLGGNTNNSTNTTEKDKDYGKVKIVLDIDNGGTDASTAITGGTKADATLVTVKSITIQDVKSYIDGGGTKYTTVTSNYKYRKSGWFDIATGTWEAGDADKDYVTDNDVQKYSTKITDGKSSGEVKMNTDILEPETAPTATNGEWDESVTIKGVTTTPKSVYAAATSDGGNLDPGVLMIPDATVAQPFVVTIDYIVRTADAHLSKGYSEAEQVITNVVSIPGGALASNKVYTLLIHLGLTSVKFEAQVDSWEDGNGGSTNTETGDDNPNTKDENNKSIYLPSNTLATSLTASAGATTSITVPAATTSFEINLTGLTENNTLEADPSSSVSFDNATVPAAGTAKATVTLTANESTTDAKATKVTITEKNSSDETITTTTVTINQAAKE